MKTRSGFVSNSSSSSFVVAFPKKPKTVEDVSKMLFNGNDHGITRPYDFCDGTPNKKIAEIVFRDIQAKKRFKRSEVVNEFETRYFCLDGNRPYYRQSEYCSTEHPLFQKMVKEEQKSEEIMKEGEKQLKALLVKAGIVEVPYAYIGGKNWSDGRPYAQEDVDAYTKYCKAKEKFVETDQEYRKVQLQFWKKADAHSRKAYMFRKKLAAIDAGKFLAHHKGKYVVVLSYGDEDGQGNLEHGGIFDRLPHVQVSHH